MGFVLMVGGIIAGLMELKRAHASTASGQSAHDFTFDGIDGVSINLGDFEGRVILVVNTASECGFTPQYEGLQALWSEYRDRGLIVLGVPSNDFGGQEPGSSEEIVEFCQGVYGVDFPLAAKSGVRGDGAHPFYLWARAELGARNAPRWNFHKYLIAPDGRLVEAFSTTTRPDNPALRQAIEALLLN